MFVALAKEEPVGHGSIGSRKGGVDCARSALAGVGALTWGLMTNDLDGAGVNLTVLGLGLYVVAWVIGLYVSKA